MSNSPNGDRAVFRRPKPEFGSAVADTALQSAPINEGSEERLAELTDLQSDEATYSSDPYETYPLSVDDIRSKLFALGISKSKDSIQRYCREGILTCVKLGMLRKYYATENSVSALIETLENDTASSSSVQLQEGADSLMQAEKGSCEQVHAAATDENPAQNEKLHAPASTIMQVHEGSDIGTKLHEALSAASVVSDERPAKQATSTDPQMLDFLKEQLRVKDEQIKVKDEQIAAMLERDRETNILIRGLQDRIGEAFGLLVSGRGNSKDIDSSVRQDGYPQ